MNEQLLSQRGRDLMWVVVVNLLTSLRISDSKFLNAEVFRTTDEI